MRTLRVVVVSVLAALFVSSCTNATESEVVKGFDGGCEDGIVVYVQNQFEPYGATVRDDVYQASNGATLSANTRYIATGWFDTGEEIYPDNPDAIKGGVWYYIPDQKVWAADASIRSEPTSPAKNNDSEEFKPDQAAPRPDECELKR